MSENYSINYISTLLDNSQLVRENELYLFQDMVNLSLDIYKAIDYDKFHDEHPEYKILQYNINKKEYVVTKDDKIIAIYLPDCYRIVSSDEQEIVMLLNIINSYEVLDYDVVITDEDTDIFDAIENE